MFLSLSQWSTFKSRINKRFCSVLGTVVSRKVQGTNSIFKMHMEPPPPKKKKKESTSCRFRCMCRNKGAQAAAFYSLRLRMTCHAFRIHGKNRVIIRFIVQQVRNKTDNCTDRISLLFKQRTKMFLVDIKSIKCTKPK